MYTAIVIISIEGKNIGFIVDKVEEYLMSSTGVLPRLDYSIFVDTGREKSTTYKTLVWLLQWKKKNNGIPLIVINGKNLFEHLIKKNSLSQKRFAAIPAFTNEGRGMLKRQCTTEFKIRQIQKRIKELQGLSGKQRYLPFENWIGFSYDEIERVGFAEISKELKVFPFINIEADRAQASIKNGKYFPGVGLTRNDLLAWLLKNEYPDPGKSSCVFCPYTSNAEWSLMKEENSLDWAAAVKVDYAIRNSSNRGNKEPIYLHKTCTPLDKVDFSFRVPTLFNCDSGVCNI